MPCEALLPGARGCPARGAPVHANAAGTRVLRGDRFPTEKKEDDHADVQEYVERD
jgi:hypothetical protein